MAIYVEFSSENAYLCGSDFVITPSQLDQRKTKDNILNDAVKIFKHLPPSIKRQVTHLNVMHCHDFLDYRERGTILESVNIETEILNGVL